MHQFESGNARSKRAGVAQLVERQPSKLNVASSNLVSRSITFYWISVTSPNSSAVERFLGKEKVSGSIPDLGSSYLIMLANVVEAKYIDGYRIEVTFSNGRQGIADLTEALRGPVFENLTEQSKFRSFVVDKELDTIVWDNGADMAPEYIYFQAFKNDASLREQFINWGYLDN